MTSSEWTAGTIIVVLAAILFKWLHWGVSTNAEGVKTVSERVAVVETTQKACRSEMQVRLAKGDANFNQFSTDVGNFKEGIIKLEALTQSLAANVQKIDERMWQDRSVGPNKRG